MKDCIQCQQSTSGICAWHDPFRNYTVQPTYRSVIEDDGNEDIIRAFEKINYSKVLKQEIEEGE